MARLVFLFFISCLCLQAQTIVEFRYHIEKYEGKSSVPYKDIKGYWTIGIGHKIHNDEIIPMYLTESQITDLFLKDLQWARKYAKRYVSNYDSHSKEIRIMLVALVFALGPTGFYNFNEFRAALEKPDYPEAAIELSDSVWARTLPNRAQDYILILKNQ
jgi:lysozyme